MNAIRPTLLLVEDNPGDIDLIREALRNEQVHVDLRVAVDGVEALAFLQREHPYADAPRPDLILLDLNIPKLDGREVLARIKEDLILRCIPVVVMTSSAAVEDVIRSYTLHANCYVTKPLDLKEFLSVVKGVENFWFKIARLPSIDSSCGHPPSAGFMSP